MQLVQANCLVFLGHYTAIQKPLNVRSVIGWKFIPVQHTEQLAADITVCFYCHMPLCEIDFAFVRASAFILLKIYKLSFDKVICLSDLCLNHLHLKQSEFSRC